MLNNTGAVNAAALMAQNTPGLPSNLTQTFDMGQYNAQQAKFQTLQMLPKQQLQQTTQPQSNPMSHVTSQKSVSYEIVLPLIIHHFFSQTVTRTVDQP